MVRTLAAGGCVLVLTACGSSVAFPLPSPKPSDLGQRSPAANLSVRLSVLFAEHTMAVGKMALAAAGGRSDEFRADATLLASNGGDANDAFSSALGTTSGSQVGAGWTAEDDARVDYIVAAVTHDSAKIAAAKGALDASVNQLTAPLLTVILPADDIPKLAAEDVTNFRNFVDEIAADNYQMGITDLVKAQFRSSIFGRLLASHIAKQFPDRYPGSPDDSIPTIRAALASDLESFCYLLTELAATGVAGQQTEQNAVVRGAMPDTQAIAAGTGAFQTGSYSELMARWQTLEQAVAAYALNGDSASRQSALSSGAASKSPYVPDMVAAVTTLLVAVDDLRAKTYDRLSADERAAAATFAALADTIVDTAIAQGKLA